MPEEIKQMSIADLIVEFEEEFDINLSRREKTIFRYAYLIGKQNWDKKDDNQT